MHDDLLRMLLVPSCCFAVSILVLTTMLRSGVAQKLASDHPNDRSLHMRPVPRTGGLAIHVGLLVAWLYLFPTFNVMAVLAAALAAASFFDDRRGLPVALRLGMHSIAAGIFARALVPELDAVAQVAVVVVVVWMTNLYNFMDGSDGLAGGMTLFGFIFLGIAALRAGAPEFAILNFSISSAAAAFLVFNFHPARIFLGDAGSIPLGFVAAAASIWGWYKAYWDLSFPLVVFSAFVADATVTLVKRVLRGDRFWVAHREHYYQRLVRMGWGHRATALAEYSIMVLSGVVALIAFRLGALAQASVTVGWFVCLVALMVAVDVRWRRFERA